MVLFMTFLLNHVCLMETGQGSVEKAVEISLEEIPKLR